MNTDPSAQGRVPPKSDLERANEQYQPQTSFPENGSTDPDALLAWLKLELDNANKELETISRVIHGTRDRQKREQLEAKADAIQEWCRSFNSSIESMSGVIGAIHKESAEKAKFEEIRKERADFERQWQEDYDRHQQEDAEYYEWYRQEQIRRSQPRESYARHPQEERPRSQLHAQEDPELETERSRAYYARYPQG